ncbi:MAG: response regulator [Eubacterium sp.]|nr:response regulator [Eubacterium sp.]
MKRSIKTLIITLTFTFILMALLVIFTARVIFRTAFDSVEELGDDKTSAITADLENYLETAKNVLWVTADTVDHMVSKGAGTDDIIEYITRESAGTEQQFDESYTGIYGYINGTYVDGVGWVPPADYDPTKRDWYKTTVGGAGNVVIVSPYVDAQTGNVIISVGKALTDNNNALALDLTLSGVQEIVENIQINGYGYGFILNKDSMIISHPDKTQNGIFYNETDEGKKLFDKIVSVGKGNFTAKINGEKCTVFVDNVMDQWHLVIVTKNSELYRAPNTLLVVSILINLVVFILLSIFYILSYRYEVRSNERIEKMKASEQRKDFEAKLLKLEKSAADTANKAKSDFLADMSHEIRTPINAILGMNEMILRHSKEGETLEYASNIQSAGNTLLSIINTILDFSKIEDGRMHLVPAPFDTSSLLNSLYHSINERAATKNLELKFDIDETIPVKLLGDDVRISQVIMNLLTNAVKYTEKGSVTFSMKNLGGEGDNIKLLVSVKDTGIGIKEEDISKLSISFERVDEKKNRHIEGTGLGISIVTKLLKMMDSQLQIKSTYGEGSDFYFELPLSIVDAAPIGKYSHSLKPEKRSPQSEVLVQFSKARILVTDDNEMNRKVSKNLLKLFGIVPEICSSGKETIELMKKEHFDILFLDHMMPEMDGIETLKKLQEASLINDTVVIALTANAVLGAREQYLNTGFDNYLSKPINVNDLEDILIRYLKPDPVTDQEAEKAPAPANDTDKLSASSPRVIETVKDEENGVYAEFVPYNGKLPSEEDTMENNSNGFKNNTASVMDKLQELGISTRDALMYCGGDESFYIEILDDYSSGAEDKIQKLTAFLEADNLKDYKILVHSVKSSSKTIGAMELFAKAKDLEAAAADEKADYLKEHHQEVMNELRDMSEKLAEIIKA